MMAYALLRQWGNDGLLNHCKNVSQFYRAKRDMFESAAKKHLSGVAEWTTPVAGMFLYIKVRISLCLPTRWSRQALSADFERFGR